MVLSSADIELRMRATELPVTFIGPVNDQPNAAWHVEQSASSRLPVKMRAHAIVSPSNNLEELNTALDFARSISHDGIARIYGYTRTNEQLMVLTEDITGLSLFELISNSSVASLDPRLFLWLAMELIRTVDEVMNQLTAEGSRYQILHGLDVHNVWVTADGKPKLVGLKPKLNQQEHSPVEGLTKILTSAFEMCKASVSVEGQTVLTKNMFRRILDASGKSISELETQVEREFFRTYKADESQHGQKQWMALVLPHLSAHRTDEQSTKRGEQKGDFTRALESRHGPVMPQPLTFADRVTGLETSVFLKDSHTQTDSTKPKDTAKNADLATHRILWFTLGFVSAIALMVLYISISLN